MRSRLAAWVAGFVWIAHAHAALAQGFDVTSQDRSVDVAITVKTVQCQPFSGCTEVLPPENHADGETAPDPGPFVATAGVPGFNGFSASQTSSLAATALQAEGSTLQTGFGAYVDSFGSARTERGTSTSHFEVAFDVATPTAYRLTGSVSVAQDTPCCIGSTAAPEAHVRFRRSSGEVLADVSAAIPLYSLTEQVGPLPLDQGGVLEPGSYVLEAVGAGAAAPFFFAQNYGTVVASSGYQVELSLVQIPAVGSAPYALLLVGLGVGTAGFLFRLRSR